jgi:hypothetical protein
MESLFADAVERQMPKKLDREAGEFKISENTRKKIAKPSTVITTRRKARPITARVAANTIKTTLNGSRDMSPATRKSSKRNTAASLIHGSTGAHVLTAERSSPKTSRNASKRS